MVGITTEEIPVAVFPQLPDLYEVVNGEIKEKPPMGIRQVTLASRLQAYLWVFVEPQQLGQAVMEALFNLSDDSPQRRPDVAFVSAERWPFDLEPPAGNAWPVVPDLAVEVISPSNTYDEIRQKIREYFVAGVRVVWVVSIVYREIEVFDPAGGYRLLTMDDVLKGEPVLKDFELPLRSLFSKRYE